MSSVGVFSGMLPFNDKELATKCVRSLLFLLFHTFPKVRQMAAEKLYTTLLAMEEFSLLFPTEELYNEAIETLSETDWAKPLKELTASKPKMYACFGLEPKQTT